MVPSAPSGATFVDQQSGIAFVVPAGCALVRTELAGKEFLGEFNFATFQVVANDSASQFTYSGSHEPLGSPDVLASIMIATSEWLAFFIGAVPSEYQHDTEVGTHRVTVLEQTPTLWGDQIRTYVVVLPHGYGVLLSTSNDTPEADDHVIQSLIESLCT